jgi:nitrite reductase/ring-hydroxylating ferredoxin subunit
MAGASRRFPFPLPDGWFAVALSAELGPGHVKRAFYLGRELVLFRTASGVARVFDAYCPHLGAHLGEGGTVQGDTLRCPFHGWRFDGDGHCVEVPYAERIPPRARIRSWPVEERYGLVFLWHHGDGKPPSWRVPEIAELESADWIRPVLREWHVRSAIQEMAENDHDSAHFPVVHQGKYLPTTVTYDGQVKTCVSPVSRELPDGSALQAELVRTSYALGFATVSYRGIPGLGFIMLAVVTPVDEENVHMRWLMTVTANLPEAAQQEVIKGISEGTGVEADIPIWENKRFVANPVLCDGDGPIAEFRRWASQFYSTPTGAPDA